MMLNESDILLQHNLGYSLMLKCYLRILSRQFAKPLSQSFTYVEQMNIWKFLCLLYIIV